MKYHSPTSVDEAIGLLQSGSTVKVFAGATDLIPQLRAGRTEPEAIIDLKKIDRLVGVRMSDAMWTIGAATPTSTLTANTDLSSEFPGFTFAAGLIGSDQIQNRSSLGGNLCTASPAADSVPAMVVNAMRVVIAGPNGTRTIPVADVVTGPGKTSLGADEFIVEFELDRTSTRSGEAYLRMTPRTEMDIAVVGAGARITLNAAGDVTEAVIALSAVAPTVVRVPDAEAALVAGGITDDTLAAVAAAASAACNPIDDKRGTIKYRRHVAGVLATRAVKSAAERAAMRPGGAS